MNDLLAGADLAFVEGMFLPGEAEAAREKDHMTVNEAAAAARGAGVKRLVLVHQSPRYHNSQRQDLRRGAEVEFPGVEVGRDLDVFQVPLPQEPSDERTAI